MAKKQTPRIGAVMDRPRNRSLKEYKRFVNALCIALAGQPSSATEEEWIAEHQSFWAKGDTADKAKSKP